MYVYPTTIKRVLPVFLLEVKSPLHIICINYDLMLCNIM